MIPSQATRVHGHQVRAMGVFSAGVRIFNEIAMHTRAQASNRMAKEKQSKSWSKSASSYSDKDKSNENKGKSKGKYKGTKSANQGAKGVYKGKTSKAGLSGLENSKSDASWDIQESALTHTTDVSWNDGWNGDEWNYA